MENMTTLNQNWGYEKTVINLFIMNKQCYVLLNMVNSFK